MQAAGWFTAATRGSHRVKNVHVVENGHGFGPSKYFRIVNRERQRGRDALMRVRACLCIVHVIKRVQSVLQRVREPAGAGPYRLDNRPPLWLCLGSARAL